MLDISVEHVLFVFAVFLLYRFMNRCNCNGFSVGGEISDTDAYNTLINNLSKNTIKKNKYKDYGYTFEINGQNYYKTKKNKNDPHVCEQSELAPIRTYEICNKGQYFCKHNTILNDTCMSRTDILNYIKAGVKNGEV